MIAGPSAYRKTRRSAGPASEDAWQVAARTKTLAIARERGGAYWLPSAEHAADENYPLARKLFIYISQPSAGAISPAAREFLRFVCSKQAQEIAARDGNFPLDAALAVRECSIAG